MCDRLHDEDHCDSRDVSSHDHHRQDGACGGALMDGQGDGPREAEECSDAHKKLSLLHPSSAIAMGSALDDNPHHGPLRVHHAHDASLRGDVTTNGCHDVNEALQNDHDPSRRHEPRGHVHSGVVWLSTVQVLL